MPKAGDIRQDGKVFLQSNRNSIGGEYWVTMEHFLRIKGSDYWDKRREREAYIPMSKEDKARKAKDRYEAKKARGFSEDEINRRRLADRKSYLKLRDTPAYKEKVRLARFKFEEKQKAKRAIGIALRREAIAKREAEKAEARRIREERWAKNRAERELAKALRPKRVMLTDEQRKDRRRDEKRNYKHRRRAIMRGLEAKATPKQIRGAMAKAKGKCYYCGGKFDKLTIDHVVPLAKGGSHTLDNLVFACHGCNSEKRDLMAYEFAGKFGMLIV